MNKINSAKNTATLSMVRNITNSCRLRFGIKRTYNYNNHFKNDEKRKRKLFLCAFNINRHTNFKILKRRNVRKTLNPEFDDGPLSNNILLITVIAHLILYKCVIVNTHTFSHGRLTQFDCTVIEFR